MTSTAIPASSPWGVVQHGRVLAEGIVVVGTARHGGIQISRDRLNQMPPALRLGRRRWFEEDCEAALVLWAFADDCGLTGDRLGRVEKSVRDWFPDKWEKHTGRTLNRGESATRDKEMFTASNECNYVVTAAWCAGQNDVPEGKVGVLARRASDQDERYFLVAATRYAARGQQPGNCGTYVVDPAVDVPWVTSTAA